VLLFWISPPLAASPDLIETADGRNEFALRQFSALLRIGTPLGAAAEMPLETRSKVFAFAKKAPQWGAFLFSI